MYHSAFTHSTVEVAVCSRCAHFSVCKYAVAHSETGTASRIRYAKTCIYKCRQDSFFQSLLVNFRRCGRNYSAHSLCKFFSFKNLRRNPKIAYSSVCAASDINLIYFGFCHFGDFFYFVRLITECTNRFQR